MDTMQDASFRSCQEFLDQQVQVRPGSLVEIETAEDVGALCSWHGLGVHRGNQNEALWLPEQRWVAFFPIKNTRSSAQEGHR